MAEFKRTLFEQMIKDFAENEVKPLAQEVDEQERFPSETVEKMAKLGLMGIIVPTQYGGAGAGYYEYITAVEELSKHCGTTGVILSAHTSLCVAPILEHGTEEQKQKYLPDLACGRKIGAFGLTEPNAGTDASNQQTVAVEMEDHYLLNGSKIFITNAGEAETYVVIAVTGKGPKGPEMTAFIVESAFEGFTFGKHEKKMGIRGSATRELIFENVKVPKENMLGKRGEGFKIAMKTLDGGRIGIAAQALAMGADEAFLVTDRAFGGSDTLATSTILAAAVKNIGYDVVFCGRQAIDGDTAQVGPQIAEHLGIPQITYAADVSYCEEAKALRVKRQFEDRYQTLEVAGPCLITILSTLAQPRYMNVWDIVKQDEKEVKYITNADLQLEKAVCGLSGSPTKVKSSFTKQLDKTVETVELSADEAAATIIAALKQRHLI